MLNLRKYFTLLLMIPALMGVEGQKMYHNTSGELIFSQSRVNFSPEFLQQYPDAEMAKNNVRFTCFLHLAEYWHYDLNNIFGFILVNIKSR